MSREFRVPPGMATPTKTSTGWQSKVSMPTDDDGFFGRECPAEDCRAFFKLEASEYSSAPDDLRLSCPVCGLTEDARSFLTADQARRAEAAVREMAQGAIRAALDDAFSGLGRHNNGPVSITYKPGPAYVPKALPSYIEAQTIRTFTCPAGGHRAVIYDLLTVCPYCGPATPPRAVLDDNLGAMLRLLDLVDHLPPEHRREVEAVGGVTALTERAIGGAVAVLQNFTKQVHSRAANTVVSGNPWQNLDRIRKQWQADFAADPVAHLSAMDVATLKLGFARRHLLEHNNGVVDAKYLAESGDKAAVGRRVRFRSAFVREFVAASMRFADELEATIPNEPARATASEGAGDDQSSDKDVPAVPPQDQSPEAPTMGIESKLEKRNAYLRALWRKSGGRTLHIDMAMDTASSVGIADETELVSVAHYLQAEGLVEIRTSGPGISITHDGVRVAERSIDPQSEEGREVELRRQDRAAFVEHAYQLVDGDEMKMFNFRDVGSELGWEEDRSTAAAEYLVDAGYLDWYTMGGNLVLTHDGIKLVEAGRKPS